MRVQSSIFLIVFAVFVSACSKTDSIKVSGSSTVLPIISVAAEQFKSQNAEKNIIVNAGGSGVGINQVGRGEVDIGMASRDVSQSEIDNFSTQELISIAIGKDAVVPAISSEIYLAGVTALSLDQIGKIYTGQISNWSDLGGPNKDILVIDKEKSRGTRHVFMQKVLGDKNAEANGADLVLGSNNEEQTAMTQSDAAIGMLSNAWLNADVIGLNIILSNGEVIEPSLANIVSGKYPITRDLLLITQGNAEGDAKAFIDFILSDNGQKIVTDAGYVSINN